MPPLIFSSEEEVESPNEHAAPDSLWPSNCCYEGCRAVLRASEAGSCNHCTHYMCRAHTVTVTDDELGMFPDEVCFCCHVHNGVNCCVKHCHKYVKRNADRCRYCDGQICAGHTVSFPDLQFKAIRDKVCHGCLADNLVAKQEAR